MPGIAAALDDLALLIVRLVSIPVSFASVQEHSRDTAQAPEASSRTVPTGGERADADLESV